MLYLSYRPGPPLNDFIDHLWLIESGQAPRLEKILPCGTSELVVNLRNNEIHIHDPKQPEQYRRFSGAVFSGTYSRSFVCNAVQHEAIMGVHFKPGGVLPFLNAETSELANEHANLADLWGRSGLELYERFQQRGHGRVWARKRDPDRSCPTQLRDKLLRAARVDPGIYTQVDSGEEAAKIVFTSSMGGLFTPPGYGIYVSTKHALEAFAEALEFELKPYGIKVQTINPGVYLTGYNETMSETPFRWLDDSKNFTKRAQMQQVFDQSARHTARTARSGGNDQQDDRDRPGRYRQVPKCSSTVRRGHVEGTPVSRVGEAHRRCR